MATRSITPHLFRHVTRFGTVSALILVFLLVPMSSKPVLAANPYELSDGHEGDPGDGVLEPQTGKSNDAMLYTTDMEMAPLDQSFILVPVFTNWGISGTPTLRLLLLSRPETNGGITDGTARWFSSFRTRRSGYAQ